MKMLHLALACLLGSTLALVAPSRAHAQAKTPQRPPPCQVRAPERSNWPQGTLLWGSKRLVPEEETSSVLASVKLGNMRLERGRLVGSSGASKGLVGAELHGTTSHGQPVDVALCAEPTAGDALPWYQIEVWNAESASWENPCIASRQAPRPRALAVPGVWDSKGARQDAPGRFTFACENGAIAKCVAWGYKPWESKNGQPLAELHQACTRMARADYCGDGQSHTRESRLIDLYDGLGLHTPAPDSSERASFEAAWSPEGAACLARTRDGRPLESVLAGCPSHFEPAVVELGEGDTCTLRRKGMNAGKALLRNRMYASEQHAAFQRP